jgi:hypothetical protein
LSEIKPDIPPENRPEAQPDTAHNAAKNAAKRAAEEAWVMRKLRHFWPVIPLAAILFALMLSDLDVMGYSPIGSNPCSLDEVDQSGISLKFYAPVAQWALKGKETASPVVAVVTIDANTEPPGLLTNTCDSRDFLGRLVNALNRLQAKVIMIDKYFSPGFCSDAEKTQSFIASLNGSAAPVIVGQPTHALSDQSSGCLGLSTPLQFTDPNANPPQPSNVWYGLNRLNSDTLKIPLQWPVFRDPPAPDPSPIQPAMTLSTPKAPPPTRVTGPYAGYGLALMAAEKFKPEIANAPKLQTLLRQGVHPYTTFLPLPHINAMTALCNADPTNTSYGVGEDSPGAVAGQPDLCLPWILKPEDRAQFVGTFQGKAIVVGDLSEQDMHPFPGGDQPGVYLQANYVQAILDQRFLEEIPLWLTLAFLVLYVIFVYCLYWAHDVHGQPRLNAEQAGIGSLIVLAALALLSFFVLYEWQFFTPLWALWGAGVFMVFRYLEASGHHRSQHLMAHLAGEGHHPPPTHPTGSGQ